MPEYGCILSKLFDEAGDGLIGGHGIKWRTGLAVPRQIDREYFEAGLSESTTKNGQHTFVGIEAMHDENGSTVAPVGIAEIGRWRVNIEDAFLPDSGQMRIDRGGC